MADLTVTGEVVVTSEKAEAAFDRVGDKATQMATEVAGAAGKAGQAVDGIGAGAEKSADKFTRAESRMRDAIKKSTEQLQLLGKTASEKLEFNINAKGLDASKFAPYIEELKKAEQAQKIATSGLDNMGMSARATAAALRGVPAQFTDIITSLQGGQAPLTVFLQQGGQLKDMFGGAGNAAKALGGYVAGLINPFTAAAAAGVVLAVAYNQGSKEADAYRLAIVSTGNAVGTTGAQLKSYAQEISGVVGTQGKAAESLAAFVSTGRVAREVLKESSQAAISWERATGQAVSTTAKQFAELGKDPLQAVLKLNDGTNFLTESVYKQIKSLDEQGRTAEAAAVAQRAYADALTGRAGEIERNLGSIETAWNKVKDAAKGGWDAILNVGRAETTQDRLTSTRKQIADLENRLAAGSGFSVTPGGAATGRPDAANNARLQAQLLGLQAQAAALEGVAFAAKTAAEAEAERAKQMQATASWDKDGAKYLSDKAKLERDLTVARNEGLSAGKSQAEIEQRLAQIRESYAKKGGSSAAAENKDLRDQQRIYAELADVSSTYYADLERAQQQRAKGNISEAQYVKYVEELIQKQPFFVAGEKANAEAIKQTAKAAAESSKALATWYDAREKESQGFANQINARREEVTLMGLSTEAVVAYTQAKYEQQAAEKEAYAAALESASFYAGEYAEAYKTAAEAARQQAQQLRELGGLEVEKANKEAAKKAADEWQRAADDINRSLTDALLRGFESGKGFAENLRDTVVNLFKTMVLRPIISAVISPISGAISGAVSSVMGGGSGGGSGVLGLVSNGSTAYNAYNGFTTGQGVYGRIGSMFGFGASSPYNAAAVGSYANPTGTVMMNAPASSSPFATTGFGVYAVVAALIANAVGAFREKKQVDSGLTGTLGKGDLSNYALWRESGTLFGGPDYSMMNPGQLISDKEAELARRRASGEEAGPALYTLEQEIKDLKAMYGTVIASTKTQSDSIQAAYSALRTNVGDMADVLGLGSEAVRKFTINLGTDVINGDTGERGLKLGGLSEEEISAKINEALATANNTLAEQVIGSWVPFTETISRTVDNIVGTGENAEHVFDTITETTSGMRYVASEYARDGEKAIDTLTRLSTSLKTVNQIWDTLGYTMLDASLAGGDFASSLVDAFGGLEAMVSKFDSYYQNFYTETERRDKSREQLQTQLSDLGMGNVNFDDPNARAEYRKAVDEAIARASKQDANRRALSEALSGIDLQSVTTGVLGDVLAGLGGQGDATPEALAGLAASLTELGASATGLGDFQQAISDYIATNAEALGIEDDAAATAAALIELSGAFAAVTQASEDSTAAAERQAEAERQAAEKAQSQAFRNLQEAYAREQKVLEARLDGLEQYRAYVEKQQSLQQESLDLITGVFDVLHSSVLDLYGSVSSTAAMQAEQGRKFIEQALGTALRTGYLPDQGQLSEAIQAARAGIDSGVYANTTEQDFAKLVLAGQLRALEEVAGKQKTDAEKQLDALQKQLDSIDEQTAAINKQIELQQEVLDYWQEQIDIANGVYDATLSVEQAISALAKSLGVELTTNTKQPYLEGSKAPRPSADSGAAFGGGGSSGAQAPARYSRLVYGGTAGVGYEGIRDQSLIDRLDKLSPVYHSFDGTGDLTGLAAAMKAAGGTIADLSILSGNYESDWRKAFEGVGIPAFAVGTNYVPRDMLAQIHEGEAIVPKAFNPWAGGGAVGSDNTALIAEIRSLRQEVAGLRAAAESTAAATGDTADVLVRVTNNGNGMVTAAAPI